MTDEPDRSALAGREDDGWDGCGETSVRRHLRVFPDVDAMGCEVPDDVVEAVRRAMSRPPVEDLDI